jgi:hypothetical protein
VILNDSLPLNDQTENLHYDASRFEVERSSFTLGTLIGDGISGKVWKGILSVPGSFGDREVAVKAPKSKCRKVCFTVLYCTVLYSVQSMSPSHVNSSQLLG